jgi:hypothetical protein
MRQPLEFLLGLLDTFDPAHVGHDDLCGPNRHLLLSAQRAGFLATEPGMNPVPSCPYCIAGTPYRIDDAYFCSRCGSRIALPHLQCWRLETDTFLTWLTKQLQLSGPIERIDGSLWRLGMGAIGHERVECFYLRGEGLPNHTLGRLLVYRNALLLHGKLRPPRLTGFEGRIISLLDVLRFDGRTFEAVPIASLLKQGGAVRFIEASGVILAGDVPLGQIPRGTREFHLVSCLAAHAGTAIPYSDLKRFVCKMSHSSDSTEEATFCQKLKSRIKRMHGVAAIDDLITTDRATGGYVLKAALDLPGEIGGG